ncbi:MAG: hypothetical protein RIF41_10500 [Polyangiaceae bacterium]
MFPSAVDVPPEQRAGSELRLRYEDITPDGRLSTIAMPQALGVGFWQTLAPRFGIGEARRETGVVPILSRLATRIGEGPIGMAAPVRIDARFRLARVEEEGATRRILLEVWADLFAPRARVHGEPPEGAGEELAVGSVYAEHVFTRPFAPPDRRRVVRLESGALAALELPVAAWGGPDALADPPDGAEALDADWVSDEAAIVFGLDHGDSNQHVNSLVYPRLFRDAALRHVTRHHAHLVGMDPLLVKVGDNAFRKPCFPGERMRAELRAYRTASCEHGGRACAVVARLLPEDGDELRGRVFGRLELGW